MRADAVVAQLGGEAEFFVGFHGVHSLLLQFVGVDFGREADAAAFVLAHVKEDANAGALDHLQCGVELRAAVAAARAEDIAGEAFAMHAHERRFRFRDGAFHQGEVVRVIDERAIHVQVEVAPVGRHLDDLLAFDEPLARAPVGDEGFDRAELQLVFAAEFQQLGQPRHGAVGVEDFAEHARRGKPGEPREIDAGLGVSGAPQDAPGFCAQWKDVAGLDEVVRRGFGVGENADGFRAVVRADAGRDIFRGIDGDGEVGAVAFAILEHHALEAELLRAFIRDGRADESASVRGHEVHRVRRNFFGGHHEVALVLAIGVVGDDDEFAGADVFENFFDRIELRINGHWLISTETRSGQRRKE